MADRLWRERLDRLECVLEGLLDTSRGVQVAELLADLRAIRVEVTGIERALEAVQRRVGKP